jgi:hypothetical protein
VGRTRLRRAVLGGTTASAESVRPPSRTRRGDQVSAELCSVGRRPVQNQFVHRVEFGGAKNKPCYCAKIFGLKKGTGVVSQKKRLPSPFPSRNANKTARQGLRAGRPTEPAGPILHLAGPLRNSLTQDNDLDFALVRAPRGRWPADSGGANPMVCRKVLAGRKPTLLLRFVGWFLLRLAERTFCD